MPFDRSPNPNQTVIDRLRAMRKWYETHEFTARASKHNSRGRVGGCFWTAGTECGQGEYDSMEFLHTYILPIIQERSGIKYPAGGDLTNILSVAVPNTAAAISFLDEAIARLEHP